MRNDIKMAKAIIFKIYTEIKNYRKNKFFEIKIEGLTISIARTAVNSSLIELLPDYYSGEVNCEVSYRVTQSGKIRIINVFHPERMPGLLFK